MADNKELVAAKGQVTKATAAATAMVIDSNEALTQATDLLGKIKKVAKFVTEKKDGFTRPAYQAYKEIMSKAKDMFDPLIDDCAEAERLVKGKMIAFRNAENERVRKEQEAIAKKAEEGRLKPETAAKKMEAVQETAVANKVEAKAGGVVFKKVKKVIVIDKQAVINAVSQGVVVADAVDLNMRVITDLVVKQGIAIPGIKVDEVDEVSASTR